MAHKLPGNNVVGTKSSIKLQDGLFTRWSFLALVILLKPGYVEVDIEDINSSAI